MPEPAANPAAARWLLAEFDATDPAEVDIASYDAVTDDWLRPVHVQAMFTVKSQNEPGAVMRVTESDYADPLRWWQ
jgi:hypothetical protein